MSALKHFRINTSPYMTFACGADDSEPASLMPNMVTCTACHDTPVFDALLDYICRDDLDSPEARASMDEYHRLTEEMS